MESVQAIKQRFEIIGNDPKLNRAVEKAIQVAPTDISVLVTGESGVGKESIPKIIHSLSHRKHGKYIAVNCGAIPEGTIDSELFGHEKGSFTGATNTREGYFEVADGGTIFLDEVGELPLTTQVRLLRVLENGEFIKVGSSQVQKTNVRIVAATNVNMFDAIEKGKFREDLFYRLSTVDIMLPPLRERKEDIHLLTALTKDLPVSVRFIEEMPFNGSGNEQVEFLSYQRIIEQIRGMYPHLEKIDDGAFSTSYNYKIPGHAGTVGVIAAFSRTFCGTCNRLRVTPTGDVKTCLYDEGVFSIRDLLRSTDDNQVVQTKLREVIGQRAKDGFEAEKNRSTHINESMTTIGG